MNGQGGIRLRNSEIKNLHQPIAPDHDILRLDVAVDNSRRMGCSQCPGHLDGNIQGCV
jgi:hypothetical protein